MGPTHTNDTHDTHAHQWSTNTHKHTCIRQCDPLFLFFVRRPFLLLVLMGSTVSQEHDANQAELERLVFPHTPITIDLFVLFDCSNCSPFARSGMVN
jgi:hypothetical protein